MWSLRGSLPVNAIYAEEDVPEEDLHFIQLNRDYFK
jgi:hypothetical protein